MVISSRERYLAIVFVAAIAALVLDRLVLAPYLGFRAQLMLRKQTLQTELAQGKSLVARKKQLDARWQEMLAGGLKSDPADAENAALHAVIECAQDAGLSLTSVRPERTPRKGAVQEVTFQAVGTGPLVAVARFLWRLENSPLPATIVETQLSSRREGADDLSVQVRLSTLYFAPDVKAPVAQKPKPAAGEAGG